MNTETTEIGAQSLAEVKLFAGLPAASLAAVEAQCQWVSIAPNESVMAIADDSTDVYCVVFGKVRVVSARDDGSEVLLAELGVGDTFGELSAFNSARRSARVIGDEPCGLGVLSADAFRGVLAKEPRVALRLIEQLARVVRAMNEKVTEFATRSPRQRVYGALVKLAVPSPVGDGSWVIESPPNHDALASQAGTDKQDVAIAIGTLAREGILERKHKRFLVRDHPRLRMMATM